MSVSIAVTERHIGDQDIKYACMFDKVKLEDVGCCLCRQSRSNRFCFRHGLA
jgi:hypothetical protein